MAHHLTLPVIPIHVGDYTVHGHHSEPDRGMGAVPGGQDRPQQHTGARQRSDAGKEAHRQAITAQQSCKLYHQITTSLCASMQQFTVALPPGPPSLLYMYMQKSSFSVY